MSLYFLSQYIQSIFKFKKANHKKISIIILGLIVAITSNYLFVNGTASFNFMKYTFPYLVTGILFGILLVMCIIIFIRKKIEDT